MGLFDLFKKKQSHTTPTDEEIEKHFPGHIATKERLAYQESLLTQLNAANERYSKDNDIDALIKAYEYAFIEANPPCDSSQYQKLVSLYLKKDDRNKAWSYLNYLYAHNPDSIAFVRNQQAKILKKEKKYIDAIDMIMAEHLVKSNTYNHFSRDKFCKDVSVCIKALKWDMQIQEDLADIINKQYSKRDFNEITLHNSYSTYLKNKGLN